jgi:hypothetical protein
MTRMMRVRRCEGARVRGFGCAAFLAASAAVGAHSGPPHPIVSDRVSGLYSISIWTDPDATDDGTAGGQFWVVIETAQGDEVPQATRVVVSVRPLDRTEPAREMTAEPVRGDRGNQFAALNMDHEGPFAVGVTIEGPLGRTTIEARAEATYDLRPPPYMLAWYLLPFVLAGLLWAKLLMRRRRR